MGISKEVQNATRQVLMNELGLTRETIRHEAIDIIQECIFKFLEHNYNKKVDEIIKSYIEKAMTEKKEYWSRLNLEKYIFSMVSQAFTEEIKNNMEITFEVKAKKGL